MKPLIDPYIPLPALSKGEFERLQTLLKRATDPYGEKEPLSRLLMEHGFKNEAAWFQPVNQRPMSARFPVTVYVPCYNAARYLDETLQAIKAQTYPVARLIVVDDGSTDNTVEIASRYTKDILKHAGNAGLAVSRNTALKETATPFFAGIDADTVVDPYWLERLMEPFSDANCGGTGGRLIEKFSATLADRWRTDLMGQHHGESVKNNVLLFGCNSILRTDLLRQLGGFNEHCKTSFDDVEISERIMKAGYYYRYIPEAVCYHQKKDTPTSIISSAYRWRVPPFELQGAFSKPQTLATRWMTEIREGIKDIQSLFLQGRTDLMFPCYLMVFQTLVVDTLRLVAGDIKAPILGQVLEAIDNTVQTTSLTNSFREALRSWIDRFITGFSTGSYDQYSSDAFYQEDFASLKKVIADLPSVFQFQPEIIKEIEQGFAVAQEEDKHEPYTASKRAALIVSPDFIKTHGKHVLDEMQIQCGQGAACRLFLTPVSPWHVRAAIVQVSSFAPQTAVWCCRDSEASYVRAAAISFMICQPDTDISMKELP